MGAHQYREATFLHGLWRADCHGLQLHGTTRHDVGFTVGGMLGRSMDKIHQNLVDEKTVAVNCEASGSILPSLQLTVGPCK